MRAPGPEIDIQPGQLRCPRCFAKDIVPSMPRGFFDGFMVKLGRIPRHCRVCGKRFRVSAKKLKRSS